MNIKAIIHKLKNKIELNKSKNKCEDVVIFSIKITKFLKLNKRTHRKQITNKQTITNSLEKKNEKKKIEK
jgi:hypothetical protein